MSEILPWQEIEWQRVMAQAAGDRLPHGLLVTGPVDSGKQLFVDELAAFLLCQGDQPVCGTCSQCRLLQAGTHPDLLTVSPEESRQIRVEQIRELIDWATQTAQQGGRKFCVIEPADKLNLQSANALLKVLEEPPAETIICLVTAQPSRLLPTLRSRCQVIECRLPTRSDALSWLSSAVSLDQPELLLEIAAGNPLKAVRTIDEDYLALRQQVATALQHLVTGDVSPLQTAAALVKNDPDRVLDIIYQLVADSVCRSMTQGEMFRHRDLAALLDALDGVCLDERHALLERAGQARNLLAGTANPNPQMLLEWVLVIPKQA